MDHRGDRALHDAWAELVGRVDWDHVAHLTFKYEQVSIDSAFRMLETWIEGLEDITGEQVEWSAFPEQSNRDVCHLHVVVKGTASLLTRTLEERWRRRYGFARVTVYQAEGGIEQYMTKAVSPDFSEGRFSNSCVGLAEGEDNEPSASERHQHPHRKQRKVTRD